MRTRVAENNRLTGLRWAAGALLMAQYELWTREKALEKHVIGLRLEAGDSVHGSSSAGGVTCRITTAARALCATHDAEDMTSLPVVDEFLFYCSREWPILRDVLKGVKRPGGLFYVADGEE